MTARHPGGALARFPRGIWALGVTSLLMDASSELVHALLPLFLTAVLGVVVLVFGVDEPDRPTASAAAGAARAPIGLADLRRLPRRYWSAAALGSAFVVARFPEAFLIVRGHDVGLATAWVPVLLVVMNVVYAASAYPAGAASDRLGTRGLLLWGVAVLAGAHLCLALTEGAGGVLAAAAAWGLHMGLTQGLLARLVADAVPVELRGTAFGLFGLATGVATVVGAVLAGMLWDAAGAKATFAAGAALALVTAIGLACRGPVAPRSGAA